MGNLEQDKSEEKKKMAERINGMFRNYNKLVEHYKYSKSRDKNITVLLNMINTVLTNSLPASNLHEPTYKSMQSMLDNLNNSFASGYDQQSVEFESQVQGHLPESENLYKIVQSHSKQLRNLEGSNAYLSEILQLKEVEIRELKSSIDKKLGPYDQEKIIQSKEGEPISIELHETEYVKEISELKKMLLNVKSENQDLQAALASKNSEIAKLKTENINQEKKELQSQPLQKEGDNGKVNELNTTIKEQETEIEKYKSEIKNLNSEIEKQKKRQKDFAIEEEKNKLHTKELESEIEKQKSQVINLEKTITIIKDDLNKTEKEKEELISKKNNADSEIKERYEKLLLDFNKQKTFNVEIEPGIFL